MFEIYDLLNEIFGYRPNVNLSHLPACVVKEQLLNQMMEKILHQKLVIDRESENGRLQLTAG